MEVIAGHFGFYGPFIKPRIGGTISFEAIEALRREAVPGSESTVRPDRNCESLATPLLARQCTPSHEERRSPSTGFIWEQWFCRFAPGGSCDSERSSTTGRFAIFENMRVPETPLSIVFFKECRPARRLKTYHPGKRVKVSHFPIAL